MSTDLDPLPPLVCIVCMKMVDATSQEAEGWKLERPDGEHDDAQWKCPKHSTT